VKPPRTEEVASTKGKPYKTQKKHTTETGSEKQDRKKINTLLLLLSSLLSPPFSPLQTLIGAKTKNKTQNNQKKRQATATKKQNHDEKQSLRANKQNKI
jgi:hypothetical protein